MIRKHKIQNLYNIFSFLEKEELLCFRKASRQFQNGISNILIKSMLDQSKGNKTNKGHPQELKDLNDSNLKSNSNSKSKRTNKDNNLKNLNSTTNKPKNKDTKSSELFEKGKIEYKQNNFNTDLDKNNNINFNNKSVKDAYPVTLECNICYEKCPIDEKNQMFLDCECIIHRPCFNSYVISEVSLLSYN